MLIAVVDRSGPPERFITVAADAERAEELRVGLYLEGGSDPDAETIEDIPGHGRVSEVGKGPAFFHGECEVLKLLSNVATSEQSPHCFHCLRIGESRTEDTRNHDDRVSIRSVSSRRRAIDFPEVLMPHSGKT